MKEVLKKVCAFIVLISFCSSLFANEINLAVSSKSEKSVNYPNQIKIEASTEKLITINDGGIVELNGASVEIPAGALSEDTVIRIERLEEVAPTDDIENTTVGGGGYRFLPAGTKFLREVYVTIPCYDFSGNAKTYFYNTEKNEWEALERISNENGKLVSVTTHFTDMIAGSLTMPETPQKPEVNLNSIKSMKAAMPNAGAGKVEASAQGNSGDASWSLQIDGLSLNAAFMYSSGQGTGEMGRGFSLNAGQEVISIDTRKRRPMWDGKDVFLIEGVRVKQEKSGFKTVYVPEKQTELKKIEYTGNAWKVYDGYGNVKVYGASVSDRNGKDEKHIFEWYLSYIKDSNGNKIVYHYSKQPKDTKGNQIESVNNNNHIYLDYIEFDHGARILQLSYENRPDIRSNGRGGYLDVTALRLSRVTVIGDAKKSRKCIKAFDIVYKKAERGLRESVVENINELNPVTVKNEQPLVVRTYSFDYNEYSKDDDGNDIIFDKIDQWGDESVNSLGYTASTSSGVSGNASGGVGFGFEYVDVRLTAGGSGSSSYRNSRSKEMLLDINGDGYLDRVYLNGFVNYYQLFDGDNKTYLNPKPLKGLESLKLNEDEENSSNYGFSTYGGLGTVVKAGAGYSYSHTETNSYSTSKGTFRDIDSDGLVDYITEDGYYKNLSSYEAVKFSELIEFKSKEKLASSEKLLDLNNPEDKAFYNDYVNTYPEENIIRVWKAPYSGRIHVTQELKNIEGSQLKDLLTDGVTFRTYKNQDLLKEITIHSNDTNGSVKENSFTIDVKKEENIYFVSDFGFDGRNKNVDFNVQIEYETVQYFETDNNYEFIFDRSARDTPQKGLDNKFYNVTNSGSYTQPIYTAKKVDKEFAEALISNGYFYNYEYDVNEFKQKVKNYKSPETDYRNNLVYNEQRGTVFVYNSQNPNFTLDTKSFFINNKLPELYTKNGYKKQIISEDTSVNNEWKKYYPEINLSDKEITTFENKGNVINLAQLDGKNVSVVKEDGKWCARNIDAEVVKVNITALGDTPSVTLKKDGVEYLFEFDSIEKIPSKISSEDIDLYINERRNHSFDAVKKTESFYNSLSKWINEQTYSLEKNELITLLNKLYFKTEYNEETGKSTTIFIGDKISELDKIKLEQAIINFSYNQIFNKFINDYYVKENSVYRKTGKNLVYHEPEKDVQLSETQKYENEVYSFYATFINNYKLYNCNTLNVTVTYYEDVEYPVVDNSIKQIKIENYELSEILLKKWDSYLDFSNGSKNSVNITDFVVYSTEKFYGGINNWYYGIWKGDPKTFSINILVQENGNNFEKQNLTVDEIENQGKNLSSNLEKSETKSVEKTFKHYQVISKNHVEIIENPEEKKKKDNDGPEYTYLIDGHDDALVGTISLSKDASKYYASYVDHDTFHCQRTGNHLFYEVREISTYLNSLSGTTSEDNTKVIKIPIAKSKTTGKDDSHGPTVNFGASASATFGLSTSDWVQKEVINDFTGDGIPDLAITTKNGILIYEGQLDEEKNIIFDSGRIVKGLVTLGENHSSVDTTGGSLTPGNPAKIIHNIKGLVKGVEVAPQDDTGSAVSFNGGLSHADGKSSEKASLNDMNGDGLLDVVNNGTTSFGVGDSYTENSNAFNNLGLTTNNSKNISNTFSGGVSYGVSPSDSSNLSCGVGLNGGLSISVSENITNYQLIDINGDGLPDKVYTAKEGDNNYFKIYYNTGNNFLKEESKVYLTKWLNTISESVKIRGQFDDTGEKQIVGNPSGNTVNDVKLEQLESGLYSLNYSTSTSVSGNGGFSVNVNIPIPIPFTPCKDNITANGGVGVNVSTSVSNVEVRMMDIDCDGYADHVLNIDGKIWYKRNLSGKVGLLKKVTLPEGGAIGFEYSNENIGRTFDMPQNKYVVTDIVYFENEADEKTFNYDEETTFDPRGKTSIYRTKYIFEDGYYSREDKESFGFGTVTQINPDNSKVVSTYYIDNYYRKGLTKSVHIQDSNNNDLMVEEYEIDNKPYALITKKVQTSFDVLSGQKIVTVESYTYDQTFKHIVNYSKVIEGTELAIYGKYGYYVDESNENYFLHKMKNVVISDKAENGNCLRHVEVDYDTRGKGNIEKYHSFYTNNNSLTTKYSYDNYGNITSVKNPDGTSVRYSYDENYGIFVKYISSCSITGHENTSEIRYDYAYAVPIQQFDVKKNSIQYEYDDLGRLISVCTDYDVSNAPAIKYEYIDNNTARTYNKISFDASDKYNNTIETVTVIDGLGRVAYVAKEHDNIGWNISGIQHYDAKQRVIAIDDVRYVESLDDIDFEKLENPTYKQYDCLDRVVKVELPDNSIQTTQYNIKDNLLITVQTDPRVNECSQEYFKINSSRQLKTKTYSDGFGRVIKIEKIDATDDNDNIITFATYEYNLMGSMIKSTDAKNNAIKVEYDLMGRRTRLESPDSGVQITHYNTTTGQLDYTQNSVLIEKGQKIVYQYDEFGRLKKIVYPDNKQLDNTEYEYDENDQIVKKIDNSGEHYYQYGKLGEIVSETIKLKQQTGTIDQQQYHEATFSYKHNYLGQMEEITYPSGEIVKYSYTNGGNVCQVTGKMKFEASDHTFKYVNNITYDKKDRRTSIEYGNGVKSLYEYDEARGWLTRLVTTDRLDRKIQNIEYRFDVTGNVISYTNDCDTFNTTQEYQYDVLGQLIEVNGKSICNKYSSGPEYVADYTQTWKFDNIGRVEKKTSNAVCPLKNDLGGDLLSYSFDYTYIEGKANQVGSCTGRYYAYDANGNMTIEQNVPIETETTGYIATVTQVKDDAYYVDQAWGVENDKQTAVSGISRRIFEYNCKNEMIVSKDSNYYTKYIYNQEGQRTSKYSSLGESLYFNEYASWTKRSGDSGNPDGRDAMHIYINGQRIVTKQNSATRYELSDQINKQYWYHTNHIGNVDVITERDGNQFERFEYTPYGETWIHHDSLYLNNSNLGILGDSIDIKYRFTGKEKDEETGYTYFGARYLDSKRGIWTQTDPALGDYIPTAGTTPDKLPGMGGIYNLVNSQLYHYAGNNPVKYTDPDGESPWIAIPIIIGICMSLHSDVQPKSSPVDVTFINEKLSKLFYYDPAKKTDTGISSPYVHEKIYSLKLEQHPLLALGAALPKGNYSESDYSNPNQLKGQAIVNTGTVLDGLSLVGTVVQNLSDGHLGDVTLNLKKTGRYVTSWNIILTTINPQTGKTTGRQVLSKEDALKYLNDNKEALKNDSVYKKLQNLLD